MRKLVGMILLGSWVLWAFHGRVGQEQVPRLWKRLVLFEDRASCHGFAAQMPVQPGQRFVCVSRGSTPWEGHE
jgi:hypothetical protein